MKKLTGFLVAALAILTTGCFVDETDYYASVKLNLLFPGGQKSLLSQGRMYAKLHISADDLPEAVSDSWDGEISDLDVSLSVSLISGSGRKAAVTVFTNDGEFQGWSWYAEDLLIEGNDVTLDAHLTPMKVFPLDAQLTEIPAEYTEIEFQDVDTGVTFASYPVAEAVYVPALPCGRFIYAILKKSGGKKILYSQVIYSPTSTPLEKNLTWEN
ncbi:hypothetical protein KKF34_00710 [Myxococcota bacterium]|nr:hypothetical protein [Myxococcota bacterium]MBU1382912.1 hypothetical protein [Myxococcota bacterium]MBU1495382.1 hypothetical protein [Myxococcota bacterium]